jgi:hypothetical protein
MEPCGIVLIHERPLFSFVTGAQVWHRTPFPDAKFLPEGRCTIPKYVLRLEGGGG